MMRPPQLPGTPPRSRPVASLADVLEPLEGDDELPTRVGTPAGADFAFADTVVANDLEVPPASTPFVVTPPGTSCTPMAFPVSTRPRRGIRGAIGEVFEAWADTADQVGSFTPPATLFGIQPPEVVRAVVARTAFTLARCRALMSAWDWSAGDLLRAAVIGAVVFALTAFAGVTALSRASAAGSPEIREPHALEGGHVAMAHGVRTKAKR